MRRPLWALAALAAAGAAACGASSPADPLAAAPACSSGVTRDVNESESPLMMPGRACSACHSAAGADTGEPGPAFVFAGTIYPTGHEPNDCLGAAAAGAEVLVTDSTGASFPAVANDSGNFMLEMSQAFVPPFRAAVRFQGRERAMLLPQTDGDCNGCHTQDGAMAAPGRIVLPD